MAAGLSRRFGGGKLQAEFEGRALLRRALESVPAEEYCAVAVVTRDAAGDALAEAFGFRPVRNPAPELGVSGTIRLGLEALGNCDAALFQVADQPLLRRETVRAELEFFRARPDCISALSHGGVRGNPCIFPASYFSELLDLTEDHGGSSVIRRHEKDLLLFEAPACELEDIDTPCALHAMRERRDLV